MSQLFLSTIGFTQSSAERFFERLRAAGVKRVVDVRLHNSSQLAGFAKASDLAYLLKAVANIEYVHEPMLAPTDEMLRAYKKEGGDWGDYEAKFVELMRRRKIETTLAPDLFDGSCLLCSEATPHRCHRRLVCEYLNARWGGRLKVRHL